MKNLPFIAATVSVFLIAGCRTQKETYSVEILHQSARCGVPEVLVQGVNSQVKLQELMGKPATLSLAGPNKTAQLPALNLSKFNYVYVSAGSKPSAGYHLSLQASFFNVNNGVAKLPLIVKSPAEGNFQAAVVTQPCALLQLAKGKYHTVEVLEESVSGSDISSQ